nr:putative reverse transcriptase domain-containing protein [Tanacetum cinerariifolium]
MCIDYHELSEIYLYSGCRQIRVHEDEIPKTDFRMRYGHFELTVMPFGLTNAPAVFMELVYTKSKEEHESHLKMNLELLKKEKCHVKPNKVEAGGVEHEEEMMDGVFSDYGCETKYRMGKANEVVDTWSDIRTLIIEEAHATKYSVHPKASNMYYDLSFDKDVEVVRNTGSYEYRLPSIDLWSEKCRSPMLWSEIGESSLIRPELVLETTDKVVLINKKLKAARDQQKSYADKRRKPLEFEVGDRVLLKVLPLKGVVRFAYRLRLRFPEELSSVHDTFHVSNLKKCLADAILHVPVDEIKVDKTLRFIEEPVEIMDREIKKLKRKKIVIVKVRWNSKCGPEFTWEHEDQMRINVFVLVVYWSLVRPVLVVWEFGKFTPLDGESLESYYSRFYKMMNELTRNQCKVTNHQVNVQFLLQLQPEWQRFVTLVKQSQELKHVSYHKLYDILKQHQHEVNEIQAEKIASVATPLALVAQQQQVSHPQTHPTHFNQNASSCYQEKRKSDCQLSSVDDDDEDTSKEKEIDKLMALISLSFKKIYKPTNNNLRTSSNTSRANQDNSPRIHRNVGYEGQRSGTVAGASETVGSSMVQKYGI